MAFEKVIRVLEGIVGPENVSADESVCIAYSTESYPLEGMPDMVVRPGSVGEIQKVLYVANKEKIPVTPLSAGVSQGYGHVIPLFGGMILDVGRLNKIIKIDDELYYAVIEPGVTFHQLQYELIKHHPHMTCSIPGNTIGSVVANYLDRGSGGPEGDHGELINTLEVVLPTGEILRTGSAALPTCSCAWTYKWGCGPDLTGMFLGSGGIFGVVTKAGVNLCHRPKISERVPLGTDDLVAFMKAYRKLPIIFGGPCDTVGGDNWIHRVQIAGFPYPWEVTGGKKPLPDEWWDDWRKEHDYTKYFVGAEIRGESEEEVALKRKAVDDYLEKNPTIYRKESRGWEIKQEYEGGLEEYKAMLRRMREEPDFVERELMRLRHRLRRGRPTMEQAGRGGAGMVWICGGMENSVEVLERCVGACKSVMDKYGFETPWTVHGPGARRGRWVLLGFNPIIYNRGDPDEVRRIRLAVPEAVDKLSDVGWIHYRPCYLSDPVLLRKTGQYLQMLKKLRKLLDPNGIMHPSKFNSALGG